MSDITQNRVFRDQTINNFTSLPSLLCFPRNVISILRGFDSIEREYVPNIPSTRGLVTIPGTERTSKTEYSTHDSLIGTKITTISLGICSKGLLVVKSTHVIVPTRLGNGPVESNEPDVTYKPNIKTAMYLALHFTLESLRDRISMTLNR